MDPLKLGLVRRDQPESERGAALVISLMAVLLLAALGSALVITTAAETRIAGSFRDAQEALYAADAAIELALQELMAASDWNSILTGTKKSAFANGPPDQSISLPDGSILDLAQATNMANCGKTASCTDAEMDATTQERPWGRNNPRWVLYAYGWTKDMVLTGTINSDSYVSVWVGDDPSENDNDPTKDGNTPTNPGSGVLALRAQAYGPASSRKVIELTIARTIRIRSWREVR